MIRLTRITRKRQSTCLLQCATVVLLGSGEAYMRRDDIIRPRIRTLAPAVRSALPPPPNIFEPRSEKQLTARADRPGRDPAHAVAFTTAVAIRGAGSVHRRTGMRTARALPVDRNRPGSPPATDCRQNSPPALRPIQTRCFADHRRAWRCDAGPDLPRAVGVCTIGRARAALLPARDRQLPSGIWQGTLCPKRGGAK